MMQWKQKKTMTDGLRKALEVLGIMVITAFLTLAMVASLDKKFEYKYAEEEPVDKRDLNSYPSVVMTWKWEVSNVSFRFPDPQHMDDIEDKLTLGWEPFGVAITGPGMVTTWFKRRVEVPYKKPKEDPDE